MVKEQIFLQGQVIVQNDKYVFPDFGEACEIQKMENLQNMPNLSGINQNGTMARYMIQARIVYKERKNKI